MAAGPALIADLRLDARPSGQSDNPVQAADFAVIQQVVVQLAVAIDLATVVLSPPQQLRLSSIFPSPPALRTLLPGIESAGLHGEAAAYCPHAKVTTMLGNERVFHFASRAKYAVAFRMSHSSVTRANSRFNW